jgi:periplasmic copper chaperone A
MKYLQYLLNTSTAAVPPSIAKPIMVLALALAIPLAGCIGDTASNPPEVKNAWIRSTQPGQKVTGAFMTITAPKNAQLIGVATPAATTAELREMAMDGDVMKLRPVNGGLVLPAGKPVELKPGSYHVMLTGLKDTMPKDTTVTLTLRFRDARGIESKTDVQVPVMASAPRIQPDFVSTSATPSIRRKY